MRTRLLILFIFSLFTQMAIGQVTITRDTFACGVDSVVMYASLTGSTPTSSGITADDGYSGVIGIGFTFNYYGTTYTQLTIGSNGILKLGTASAGAYCPWPITAALAGNASVYNCICGPWCDIYIPAGGTITYATVGTAPNRKFTANWCATRMFSCTSQYVTSQIILYETSNLIEVHLANKTICSWNGGRAIIGVQNASGSASTAAPSRDWTPTWTATNEAWRFTPSSSFASYSVGSISYAPIPYASSSIYWYDSTTGAYLGTGPIYRDTASVPRTYIAAALGCGDTSRAYMRIDNRVVAGSGGRNLHITSYTTTQPSICGVCDATITLNGINPFEIDTIFYSIGGVAQTPRVDSAGADSVIVMRGLCAGTYDYIYVKVGHCPSNTIGPITISNPPFTIGATSFVNPSVCGANDGSITLYGIIRGFSDTIRYLKNGIPQAPIVAFASSGGTLTIGSLGAGIYSNITVTMNDCTTPPVAVTLTNPAFGISSTSFVDATCSACDGVITLRGLTPGQTITVNMDFNGTPMAPVVTTSSAAGIIVLTGLCPGVYSNVTATLNTCVSSPVGPIRVSPPPLIPISIYSRTQPTECGACNGNITIKGTPPGIIDTIFYTKNGIPQTPIISSSTPDSLITIYNLCEGVYSNFFIKSGPCPTTTIRSAINLVDPPIVPGFTHSIRFGCKGDTVTFTNTSTSPGRLWYVWSFGDGASDTNTNVVHVYTAQNIYHATLTVTNHFCVDSISQNLNLTHPIKAIFSPSDTTICQNTPMKFGNTSIGTPPTYVWNFGDGISDVGVTPTHAFRNTGRYKVQLIATNFVPCSDTAYNYVTVDSFTEMSMALSDTVLCQGTYITLSSNYTNIGLTGTVWDMGNGDSIKDKNPFSYAYLGTGTFNIRHDARYRVCNPVSVTRKVTVIAQPNIDLGPDKTICTGNEVITIADDLNAANPAARWLWNNGNTTNSVQAVKPGIYAVTLNINNCTTLDTVEVKEDCYLHIPNIFSPNDDGVNDYFCPRNLISRGLVKFKMSVYNRWGQLIFETINIDGRGWDGKFNALPQPQGVYMYMIDATFRDGTAEHRSGNVTLLR